MLDWTAVDDDTNEEDFLASGSDAGEPILPAACPLNPEGLEGCEAYNGRAQLFQQSLVLLSRVSFCVRYNR